MSSLKTIVLLCVVGYLLTACGAPPEPKKPGWANESPAQFFRL